MEDLKQKKKATMFVIRLNKDNEHIKEKIKQIADDEGLTVNAYMNDMLIKIVGGT